VVASLITRIPTLALAGLGTLVGTTGLLVRWDDAMSDAWEPFLRDDGDEPVRGGTSILSGLRAAG
jgi:hypothetical protein